MQEGVGKNNYKEQGQSNASREILKTHTCTISIFFIQLFAYIFVLQENVSFCKRGIIIFQFFPPIYVCGLN